MVRALLVAITWLALASSCDRKGRWTELSIRPPDPPLGKRCRDDGTGPLRDWMTNNLNPQFSDGEYEHVGAMLDALAEIAPDGYRDWGYWATKGARASRQRARENVRSACQGCHDGYSARYCKDDRARRLQDE